MRVYLSGPISLGGKLSDGEMSAFVDAFRQETTRLRALRYKVTNPCELAKEDTWEDYMRHGMRAVADADVVLTLPRWLESRGAMLEVFVATQLKIPVIAAADFPA